MPKLEMSNIDTYSGNNVSVLRADVGDSASNVYVGKESGNSILDIRACCNVSAFGYSAGSGISNVSNSVYLGYRAGAGSFGTRNTIAIGSEAGGGGAGSSNIFIGSGTKSTLGSRNIFIGHGIDLSSVSNQIRIGYSNQTPIAADISSGWVGLTGVTSPTASNVALDVSGLTMSTGGFASFQSNRTFPSSGEFGIGYLKKGIVLVSAVDEALSTNYATAFYFAPTNTLSVSLLSNFSGSVSINTSLDQITLSNTGGSGITYRYSITYFPLP
jgi:hypothetical protein